MKAVVAAFNQEKALVGAFSVNTNLRMELFQALVKIVCEHSVCCTPPAAAWTLLTVSVLQMEDDVEVELELEKQLALAHELFPT